MTVVADSSYRMQGHGGRIGSEAAPSPSGLSKDNDVLGRTGKRAILKRNFGFISMVGFTCLVLSTWQGAFVLLGVGLTNGGPAGIVYSFTLVWVGNLATFSSLAELASMAPTAGGQYHWVSMLAPKSSQKILSYITGWLTVTGWEASVAASAYVCGTLIQGFIELVDANYAPQLWHATLLLYAVLALSTFTTTVIGTNLPKIETALLVIYVCGFIGVIVPLVYLAPHASAANVFALFLNSGGWSSQGLSFFVGISGNAFAFLGADSVYHMSEEVQNAPVIVPKAIFWSIVLNGVVGLSMFIAILFCIGDLEAVTSSTYIYEFIEVLLQATNSTAGSATILMILIIVDLGLVIGVVAAASRMLWSFARDRGVPGWRQISKVDPKTTIPVRAVITTVITSILLGLISIGSPVAFNDVISLTVNALYSSYFVACALLLWRRCQGRIQDPFSVLPDYGMYANLPGSAGKLVWGPWRMPEPLGTAINAFACIYLSVVFIFTFFPPSTPVTPNTMNYSSLVMGSVAIVSGLYYTLRAHKVYTGPIVDFDVSSR